LGWNDCVLDHLDIHHADQSLDANFGICCIPIFWCS